jgi:hypothetical protein
MKVLALALVAVAAIANVAVAPASASTGTTAGSTIGRDNVAPCQDGNPPAPGERCRGPVDNESGGGGTGLTIAVSVVVGLGIATVAFIVLRRQLGSHRPSGGPTSSTGVQP